MKFYSWFKYIWNKIFNSKEMDKLKKRIEFLEWEIKQYTEIVNKLKQKENPKEKEFNNKYPKADIEYCGRTFGTSKVTIPIDVRLLITPQDFHILKDIKQNNLEIKNPEIDIPKLYKYIKEKYYKYITDDKNYGITEFWEFPFEILEKKRRNPKAGFDCDSWANFQASYYIASGLESWKVRVVVGNCKLGGHSTVYVYSEEDNKFHHLNSTYNHFYNKISEYPTTDDAYSGKDIFGIKEVWFSFNNLFAWHKFSSEAKEDYNKSKERGRYLIK